MVPHLLHFVWVQGDGPKTFGYGEFLSVVSALQHTTYHVTLHTNLSATPSNPYCPYRIAHPRFRIQPQDMPLTVHGVKARMANLSDIWRIRVLFEHGGIYSDLDILWFKDVSLPDAPFVAAYENPAYKTAANAFLASVPGYPPLKGLLETFDGVFHALAAKGVTDLTVDPPTGLPKHHTLLWKTTGNFSKEHGVLLGKQPFYRNGWRRIGRCLRRAGVPLKPVVTVEALGATNDRLQLDDITGFHYYATLYDIEQVMELPDFREKITPILDAATTFLA
jgi:hypothetical protein